MKHSPIKTLRESVELSQTDFAQTLGISQGMISRLEQGTLTISKILARQIAEKFSLKAEELTHNQCDFCIKKTKLIQQKLKADRELAEIK